MTPKEWTRRLMRDLERGVRESKIEEAVYNLVRETIAEEREACAKVAEEKAWSEGLNGEVIGDWIRDRDETL